MRIWSLGIALMLALPAPALACSPVPPPETPPTQEQIDGDLRATFASAKDLIDYVVVRRATSERQGMIRVTRSYKRTTRPGASLRIWTADGPACGSGDAEKGTKGRMFLEGEAPYQYRNLPDAYYDAFARLGLVPPR
ncbi:MAG: hypothetical protein EOP61_11945 [Sphingomonadales bacterium]|nr:MAG: hypothetical protein EOP61_11945 [Sphingomonadales bacterium]